MCLKSVEWMITMKADLLLLANVFKKFINTYFEYYGLDPCHYVSSPSLGWDTMLKMTRIELELISDIDMHLIIEKRIREGTSYIAKRHCKANNKYMQYYGVNKLSKFITYLDASNLYGWAMSQCSPNSGFKWLNQEEINSFDVNSIEENNPIGYLLELDLEYLDELHELHNDYPLAPEKLQISHHILSNYCINIASKYDIKIAGVNIASVVFIAGNIIS